jgi:alanine dehydrogenase
MLVDVPREIKDNEYRAGMVPTSVVELVHHNHQVVVTWWMKIMKF